MAKTRAQLRADLSKEIFDYWASKCSGNGTTATVVDTSLADRLRQPAGNQWVYFTSGNNISECRRVLSYTATTITVARAFSNATATNETYELHSFDPVDLHFAIEYARTAIYRDVFLGIDDETLFTQANLNRYALPSTVVDVKQVKLGRAYEAITKELLENAGFEKWTSSSDPEDWAAATELTLAQEDTFVWQGGYSCKCTATTSAGELPQSISDPTDYAGQRLTFLARIYCMTASRVKVALYDGTTTTSSTDFHGGAGWELIEVSATMPSAPSEVTAKITNAAGTVHAFYVDACHLWAGLKRPSGPYSLELNWDIVNDVLVLKSFPSHPRSLRIIGTGYLSAVTSDTASMEINDPQTQILYAAAAKWLYQQLSQREPGQDQPTAQAMIAYWDRELELRKRRHAMASPALKRNSPDFGISG